MFRYQVKGRTRTTVGTGVSKKRKPLVIYGRWIILSILLIVILHSRWMTVRTIPDDDPIGSGSYNFPYSVFRNNRYFGGGVRQSHPRLFNGTIVVQLSGEMGNNLHKISFAKALQWMAEDSFDLHLNVILRHQDHPKWISAKNHLQKCFINLRQLNFKTGNGRQFTERMLEQKLWLTQQEKKGLEMMGNGEFSMKSTLQSLKTILENKGLPPTTTTTTTTSSWYNNDEEGTDDENNTIHLPLILVDQMVGWKTLDRYRQRLVEWFEFDSQKCCPSDLPLVDESVFHFRNFVTELKNVTRELGFEELSPTDTAETLLSHLSVGDKIAMTTRFNNNVTQEYVKAMERKGFQVRLITDHSPTEDFCFLMKAQKELIGGQRSSFFLWAAYLGIHPTTDRNGRNGGDDDDHHGGIQKVRSYSLNPPAFPFSSKDGMRSLYEWEDPILKEKWEFVVFRSMNRTPPPKMIETATSKRVR